MNKKLKITKKEVKKDVEVCFKRFFTEYNFPEEIIDMAVTDV